jgi:hypothetical protein
MRGLDHEAPDPDCTCGFYATYQPSSNGGHFFAYPVAGIIEASGRIILGTKGFRAQRTRIVALMNTAPYSRDAAEMYDVPLFGSSQEALEAFPPHDISEISPEIAAEIAEEEERRQELIAILQAGNRKLWNMSQRQQEQEQMSIYMAALEEAANKLMRR